MASIKTLLQDTIGSLVFKSFTIDEVHELSPHFRRFRLSSEALRTTSACAAGDKLQVMVPDGGPRTYSPFAHDVTNSSIDLLAFVHGDAPAARWARSVAHGTQLRGFGPRGSLALGTLAGPVVLFGDETSFASAAALRGARSGSGASGVDNLAFVFECNDPDESAQVLRALDIEPHALVRREPNHAHLARVDEQLRSALTQHGRAQLILTGHAQSIQGIRSRLKAKPAAYAKQQSKAYWADGKRGLD